MSGKVTEKFEFLGKEKIFFIALMAVGLISIALTIFNGGEHANTRLWSNILHNSTFFMGLAFASMFFLAANTLAYSGWYVIWKRILEANAQFMIVGVALVGIILLGLFLDWHHLYHWAFPGITDPAEGHYDEIIAGKAPFLNKGWFAVATIGFGGFWYLLARLYRNTSLAEDKNGTDEHKHYKRLKVISGVFLPVAGFTSAAAIWLWIMSIDAHWYSTLFAWYCTASWVVSALAFSVLLMIYLQSRGYMKAITQEHLHDLGKYLFGISIFWTYLFFSQFMLIWYANVGEETVYFDLRLNEYAPMFFLNLFLNFLLPLLILMRNDTKRKYGTLSFIAILIIFMHWVDFFIMIKPGVLHTEHEYHHVFDHKDATGHHEHGDTKHLDGHEHGDEHGVVEASAGHGHESAFTPGFTMPGFLEIGTFLGFFGLFLFIVFWNLSRASLLPPNDPYLGETLHHHVGYGGGKMFDDDGHGHH